MVHTMSTLSDTNKVQIDEVVAAKTKGEVIGHLLKKRSKRNEGEKEAGFSKWPLYQVVWFLYVLHCAGSQIIADRSVTEKVKIDCCGSDPTGSCFKWCMPDDKIEMAVQMLEMSAANL